MVGYRRRVLFSIGLLSILFLPAFVKMTLSQTSFAAGLFLSLCFLLVLLPKVRHRTYSIKTIIIVMAILVTVFMHAILVFVLFPGFDIFRFISSLLFMMFCIFVALHFSYFIQNQPSNNIDKVVQYLIWFFVLNALIGLLKFNLYPAWDLEKPVGLFSEPSHFVLSLTPVLIYACAARFSGYLVYLIFFLIWGFVIESLVAIVLVMLCFFMILSFKKMLLVFSSLALFVYFAVDVNYFVQRILLSPESNNLSVIVFLMGWDMAHEIMMATSLWGSGFQQFGVFEVDSQFVTTIAELGLEGQNQFDGGSTAPKIIGEFGMLGLFIIMLYIYLFLKFFLEIKQQRTGEKNKLLFQVFVIAFALELFVRGVGYFSPGAFLLLVGLMGLVRKSKKAIV